MNVNGKSQRSIWVKQGDEKTIQVIDQRHIPHDFVVEDIQTAAQAAAAIKEMHIRGAPLIGVVAAYGMYLACLEAAKLERAGFSSDLHLENAEKLLRATRPTAINLMWALDRMRAIIIQNGPENRIKASFEEAGKIAEEDAEMCRMIGVHGLPLIEEIAARKKGQPVNILTHCNAGWPATVDWGTATSPIYQAHNKGIPVHVWVEETRPRNQGAITSWELGHHGVPHSVIVDNAGGHIMQHGLVDMVFVGTDRTTRTGDVANKIGTYLKALAAHDNRIPFYVCLPGSTFDWTLRDGLKEIPIETRDEDEVLCISGKGPKGMEKVRLYSEFSRAVNYGFDVTPAKYVTGLITERGVCPATEAGILRLYPEQKN